MMRAMLPMIAKAMFIVRTSKAGKSYPKEKIKKLARRALGRSGKEGRTYPFFQIKRSKLVG
jgi:hypothetical protein